MDFRDEVFMAVAENLSFSGAAKQIHISQPAVSKHIAEMEQKIGVSLFERKSNRVYLTEAGMIVYNYLKDIRKIYEELSFEIGKLNDSLKGKLRIGASSTISQYLIPSLLSAFYKRYPDIQLYLYNGNSFQMQEKLLCGDVDLVLVENESVHTDIKYFSFLDDEIVLVTGSESIYSNRNYLTISELMNIPIVLREKGSGTLEVIENVFLSHNIDIRNMNIFIHLGSTEAIKNFLRNFDGIALVSEKSIEKELQLRILKILKLKDFRINRKFRIGLKYGNVSKIAELFIHFLKAYNF
jgi:DNA-binding transcriptional LysR family regulator